MKRTAVLPFPRGDGVRRRERRLKTSVSLEAMTRVLPSFLGAHPARTSHFWAASRFMARATIMGRLFDCVQSLRSGFSGPRLLPRNHNRVRLHLPPPHNPPTSPGKHSTSARKPCARRARPGSHTPEALGNGIAPAFLLPDSAVGDVSCVTLPRRKGSTCLHSHGSSCFPLLLHPRCSRHRPRGWRTGPERVASQGGVTGPSVPCYSSNASMQLLA